MVIGGRQPFDLDLRGLVDPRDAGIGIGDRFKPLSFLPMCIPISYLYIS
jgi:hypothetical protein